MQHQFKQEKQVQMNDKPLLKEDNRMFRVHHPIRTELSLVVFFLLKGHISKKVKKTAVAHPKVDILFGKVGGSWWKPEYRIIVAGKTKNTVLAAGEMLQKSLNGGKAKS